MYLQKSSIDAYLKDEGLMLNLLDRIKANIRQKNREEKYKNRKKDLVQLAF